MPSVFSLNPRQKKEILIRIVAELIRNSGGYIYTLEKFIKDKERDIKDATKKRHESLVELVHEQEITEGGKILQKEILKEQNSEKKEAEEFNKSLIQRFESSLRQAPLKIEKFQPLGNAKLIVPEEKLPAHLQYLRPIPSGRDLELGKLNPLIKDPQVVTIECPGPDSDIMVSGGTIGTKKTGITLNRDEISDVVDRFSRGAKIPVHEGVFRVVVGRLVFLAIVSEIIGSRFTIKKMIAEIPIIR